MKFSALFLAGALALGFGGVVQAAESGRGTPAIAAGVPSAEYTQMMSDRRMQNRRMMRRPMMGRRMMARRVAGRPAMSRRMMMSRMKYHQRMMRYHKRMMRRHSMGGRMM